MATISSENKWLKWLNVYIGPLREMVRFLIPKTENDKMGACEVERKWDSIIPKKALSKTIFEENQKKIKL